MKARGRPQARSGRSGFTLVEVALAILVIAVGLLGAFSLFPAGLTASRDAVDDSQIGSFARGVLSELRMFMATNYSDDAASFAYPYKSCEVTPNVVTNIYTDDQGFTPLGRCLLQVAPVQPGQLAEARLQISPGLGGTRHLVFYGRYANYNK